MEYQIPEGTDTSGVGIFINPQLYTTSNALYVPLVVPSLSGTKGEGLEWIWEGLDLTTLEGLPWTDPSDLDPTLDQKGPSQIETRLEALLTAAEAAREEYERRLLANSKLSDKDRDQDTMELWNHKLWLNSLHGCTDWLESGFKNEIANGDTADSYHGLPKDFAGRADASETSALALARAILTERSQQVSLLSQQIRNISAAERMDLLTDPSINLSYAQRKAMGDTLRWRLQLSRPKKTAKAMDQEVETLTKSMKQAEYEVKVLRDKLAEEGTVLTSWSDFVSQQQKKSAEISTQAEALADRFVTDEPATEDTGDSAEGEDAVPVPEASETEPDVGSINVDSHAASLTKTLLNQAPFDYAGVLGGEFKPRRELMPPEAPGTNTQTEANVDDGFTIVSYRK